MKKVYVFLIVSITALNLTAQTPKPKPKLALQSISTIQKPSRPEAKNLLDSFSYMAGYNVATNMKQQGITSINASMMEKGVYDYFNNLLPLIPPQIGNQCLQRQLEIFNKVKSEEEKRRTDSARAVGIAYLEKNIAHHGITNVIPVRKALSGTTGTTTFFMDGTMASGIRDFVVYSDTKHDKEVPTINMEDACKELGCVPAYVKMDIEGAELSFIEGAKEFLRTHPVHFAIESYHKVNGDYTYKKLDPIFEEIGYEHISSDVFKQVFTWAKPRG